MLPLITYAGSRLAVVRCQWARSLLTTSSVACSCSLLFTFLSLSLGFCCNFVSSLFFRALMATEDSCCRPRWCCASAQAAPAIIWGYDGWTECGNSLRSHLKRGCIGWRWLLPFLKCRGLAFLKNVVSIVLSYVCLQCVYLVIWWLFCSLEIYMHSIV